MAHYTGWLMVAQWSRWRIGVASQAAAVALVLGLVLCACGSGGGGGANDVTMGPSDFQQRAITIKPGESVHFSNPAIGGGVHVICTGEHGVCKAEDGAPAVLNDPNGITTRPGDQAFDVAFPNKGIFHITCTLHPEMLLTVTVQ